MKLSRTSVGLAIRAAREAACLTLKDLAALSGVSFSLLSRTELGERDVGYLELLAIAEALRTDELTLREYAKTFEREGLPEKRQMVRDLNRLQRQAIGALIELAAGR
jgi:transcriptional regulator with XRE-family HTH domain